MKRKRESQAIFPQEYSLVGFLNGAQAISPVRVDQEEIWKSQISGDMDFEEVKGQEHARRGLEAAAAGGHNVLTL